MTNFPMHTKRNLLSALAIIIAIAGIAGWSSIASAQQPVPSLNLGFEPTALPGETLAISAYLTDPLGNPIYDAEIEFSYDVEFMNVTDSVEIGSAITDDTGLALVIWHPRSDGDNHIVASFAGDDVFTPANDMQVLEVLPGTQLYRELPPYRIPGANVWLTTGLITTVWVIFIFSLALVGWANLKTRNSPHTGSTGDQRGGSDA
jgi:hypothetical protein